MSRKKQTKKQTGIKLERTLVLLKPDAINRGVVGEILHRFERIGVKMVGMKLLVSTKDTAMKHYRQDIAERYGQHIRDLMVNMLTSGPVIAMVWEGVGVIEVIRKIVGATYPALAAPGTIRGDFAHVSKDYANIKGIGVFNLIHASATPEEAKIEISVWFRSEELVQHYPIYTKFTLREDD